MLGFSFENSIFYETYLDFYPPDDWITQNTHGSFIATWLAFNIVMKLLTNFS